MVAAARMSAPRSTAKALRSAPVIIARNQSCAGSGSRPPCDLPRTLQHQRGYRRAHCRSAPHPDSKELRRWLPGEAPSAFTKVSSNDGAPSLDGADGIVPHVFLEWLEGTTVFHFVFRTREPDIIRRYKTNILSLNAKKENYSLWLVLQDFSSKLPWDGWIRSAGKTNWERGDRQGRRISSASCTSRQRQSQCPGMINSSDPFRPAIYAE